VCGVRYHLEHGTHLEKLNIMVFYKMSNPLHPIHDMFGYNAYDAAYKAAEKAELNRQHIPLPSYPPPSYPPPSYPPPSYPPPSYPPPPPHDIFGYGFVAANKAADKLPEGWRKAIEPETGKPVWVHDETGKMSYVPPVGGAKNKKKHSCRTKRRRHRRKASRRSTGNK